MKYEVLKWGVLNIASFKSHIVSLLLTGLSAIDGQLVGGQQVGAGLMIFFPL